MFSWQSDSNIIQYQTKKIWKSFYDSAQSNCQGNFIDTKIFMLSSGMDDPEQRTNRKYFFKNEMNRKYQFLHLEKKMFFFK